MSKKTTTLLIIIVLLAMILTGTFAWLQYNQHKTNEANGSGLKYDASLIENFKEIENWKVSAAAVTKEIRVKNSGLLDGTYGDVYVRLQLKEYMEMAKIEDTYSDYRLMIGTDGKFLTYATKEAAELAYPGHSVVNPISIENTEGRWYVVTEEGDDNGQYGKFLILSSTSAEAVPLIEDTERATDTENHDLATNGECAYPVHVWQATPGEPDDCVLKSHEYIKWYLGEDVISIDEWNGDPIEAWIYDTTSPEGWVYWGVSLAPGRSTSNLLEKIQLIKQPDDNFYYAIHVDMEAVSFNELSSTGKWSEVSDKILTALAVPTVKDVTVEATATEAARGAKMSIASMVTAFNGATEALDWTIKANTTLGTFSVFTESPTSTKDGSTISPTGVLKIAPGETAPSLTITATSKHDPDKSDSVTINLHGPLVTDIVVSGPTTAIAGNATEAYSAVVKGSDDPSWEVRWEVEESSKSSANTYMDEYGILHVGVDETSTTLIVKAISTYDETKVGTMKVTVFGEITLMRTNTYTFAATAIGADGTEQPLIWNVDSANSATMFVGNLLTIAEDEIEETLMVTASTYDGTIVGTLTVKVGQIGRVSINETDVTLYRSGKGTSEQEFSVTVNAVYGADEEILWSVSGNSSTDTSIATSSETTAELTVGSDETSQSLTVTAASTYDPYRSSSVVVKVVQPTGVTISPADVTLYRSGKGTSTQTFTANVNAEDSVGQEVTWSLSGNSSSGTTLEDGVLTIGSTETSQSLMVTATSVYDPTRSASMTVLVGQVTGVTISPTTATLQRPDTGGTSAQTFTMPAVTSVNSASTAFTWSITGKSSGSTTAFSGNVLTIGSNETSMVLTVTATSTYDDTKTASAIIYVGQAIGVSVATTGQTVSAASSTPVTVNMGSTVYGVNNASQTVTWGLSGSNPAGSSTINASTGVVTINAAETSTSLTVTATSIYDDSKIGTTAISVAYQDIGNGVSRRLVNGVEHFLTIRGVDNIAGNTDDNKLINPAGTELLTGVTAVLDSTATPYVALGNGFNLYAGDDGKLGTGDDLVMGFGSFAQETTLFASKQALNWRLLKIDTATNKAILVTDKVLSNLTYNTTAVASTWETSNLRRWLNSDTTTGFQSGKTDDTVGFLAGAFTATEQGKIADTTVSMAVESFMTYVDANPTETGYSISPSWTGSAGFYTLTTPAQSNTTDKVWALSGSEVWTYFGVNSIATAENVGSWDPANYTNGYAKGNVYAMSSTNGTGTYQHQSADVWANNSQYWLRSPGQDASRASFIGGNGGVHANTGVTTTNIGARPAITVKLQP